MCRFIKVRRGQAIIDSCCSVLMDANHAKESSTREKPEVKNHEVQNLLQQSWSLRTQPENDYLYCYGKILPYILTNYCVPSDCGACNSYSIVTHFDTRIRSRESQMSGQPMSPIVSGSIGVHSKFHTSCQLPVWYLEKQVIKYDHTPCTQVDSEIF